MTVRSVAAASLIVAVFFATLARPAAQPARPAVDPALMKLVNVARADIDRFWRGRVKGYTSPADVVMFQAPATTDCGKFDRPNAFYCSSTQKIYWDASLFAAQYQIGDYAPVFILAHEWGHLVQHRLGFWSSEMGLLTVQLELQADCLAGTYTLDASKRGIVDPSDDDEVMRSLRRAGDRLQAPWFDANAHGSPGRRIDAFLYGFEGNDCTADAFMEFLSERGIDPSRAQQQPTRQAGALAGMIERQIGRFTLTGTKRTEIPNATDAIEADYRTPDGIEVSHLLVAFASPDQASRVLEAAAEAIKKKGYREVKRQPVATEEGEALGTLIVLRGPNEIVYWTNRQFLGMSEGPRDIAWEFYNAVPY